MAKNSSRPEKGFKSRQRLHWPLTSNSGMAAAAKKTGAMSPLVSTASASAAHIP